MLKVLSYTDIGYSRVNCNSCPCTVLYAPGSILHIYVVPHGHLFVHVLHLPVITCNCMWLSATILSWSAHTAWICVYSVKCHRSVQDQCSYSLISSYLRLPPHTHAHTHARSWLPPSTASSREKQGFPGTVLLHRFPQISMYIRPALMTCNPFILDCFVVIIQHGPYRDFSRDSLLYNTLKRMS